MPTQQLFSYIMGRTS